MKKNTNKNLSKKELKSYYRISLILIFLVLFSFSIIKIHNLLFKNNEKKVEQEIYSYTNEYHSNYKVNIKDNPFIKDISLPSGQTYVSDLIDSLNIDITYKYLGSKDSLINYNYKIDAIISSNYTDNGKQYNVWNKVYNLKTIDSMSSNKEINISENLNVNFQEYNQEVKNFKQSLGMSLDTFLYIRLNVNTETFINDNSVKNEYMSNFSISLGNKISIVNDKNNDKNTKVITKDSIIKEDSINIFMIILYTLIIITCIYTIYYILFKTKKTTPIKNNFRIELNKILKLYQDKIVIVENQFNIDEHHTIDIKGFEELIKLSEELYKPILCWISDDISNEQAWFSIVTDKFRYRFILQNKNS